MRDGDPLRIDLPPAVATVLADPARRAATRRCWWAAACATWSAASSRPTGTWPPPRRRRSWRRLFPGASWENQFGTVTVRDPDGGLGIEVTTYRVEAGYRDQRRPDEVRWGESLAEDLARRDFTVNAMAWLPDEGAGGSGRLVDPFGGAADLEEGLLRAVGDPDARFGEDALRLLRAVRLATRFDLRDRPGDRGGDPRPRAGGGRPLRGAGPRRADADPGRRRAAVARLRADGAARAAGRAAPRAGRPARRATGEAARRRRAGSLAACGGCAARRGSRAAPGRAAARRRQGDDAGGWPLPAPRPRRRAPGRGRSCCGSAHLAPRSTRVARLVRHHMFAYTPDWTDAAVRRFVRRVGVDLLPDLFALREADDVASGVDEPPDGWRELRERVAARSPAIRSRPDSSPSPATTWSRSSASPLGHPSGKLLAALLEAVVEDPRLNSRDQLLELARAMASG